MLNFKFTNRIFTLVFIAVAALIWYDELPLTAVLFLSAAWFFLTFLGSVNIRWNYFLTSLNKGFPTDEKSIALTFDDGPDENTLKILELLKKFNAKATFFCIGHKIDEHPEIFKKIILDGHQVGNHTYSHSNANGFFGTRKIVQEIEQCNLAAKSHAKLDMNLFRPPFGVTNPNIRKALEQTGHQSIGWSVRTFDTVLRSEKKMFDRVVRKLKPGAVILFHDTNVHNFAVLEQLLLFLKNEKLETKTIGSLFKIDAYN